MNATKPRILLVYPPFYRLFKDAYSLTSHPLALGHLASAILKRGAWDVLTYNADFNPDPRREQHIKHTYVASAGFASYLAHLDDPKRPIWDAMRATIAAYQPTVVGICIKSPLFASGRMVARIVKQLNKNTVVIAGGAHVSTVGGEVLQCPDVDIGVIGEGERTIVELLDALQADADLSSIKGLVFRRDGQIIQTPCREFIEDLDVLGFPHETAPTTLKDYDAYPRTAFQYIFATRGCPFGCFFCGSRNVWTRQVRFRSPENVTAEINSLRGQFGLKRVFFSDDTFGVTPRYIQALCEALRRDCPGLHWGCETHANVVTEESIAAMKRAGCDLIKLGVESGNNDILRQIQKSTTIEQAYVACDIINRHRIALQVFFQVGFPWETEQTLADTVAAMKRIKSDFIILSIFTPYPGTAAFDFCRKNGLIDEHFDIALFNHQSPANHFCLGIQPQRFRVLVAEIEKMVDRMNHLRRLKRLMSVQNVCRKVSEIGLLQTLKVAANGLANK